MRGLVLFAVDGGGADSPRHSLTKGRGFSKLTFFCSDKPTGQCQKNLAAKMPFRVRTGFFKRAPVRIALRSFQSAKWNAGQSSFPSPTRQNFRLDGMFAIPLTALTRFDGGFWNRASPRRTVLAGCLYFAAGFQMNWSDALRVDVVRYRNGASIQKARGPDFVAQHHGGHWASRARFGVIGTGQTFGLNFFAVRGVANLPAVRGSRPGAPGKLR